MAQQYHPRKIGSIRAAFLQYLTEIQRRIERGEAPKNAVSLARTALLTYTVPGWNGPIRKGQRTTKHDIEVATQFLDPLPIDQLREACQAQERYFEQIEASADVRKTNRYQLNLFVNWAIEKGYLQDESESDEMATTAAPKPYRHSSREAHLQGKVQLRSLRLTDRVRREDFGLRPEALNPTLKQQLENLAQFEAQYLGHAEASIKNYAAFLRRMLGWLYQYKRLPLADLSLQHLIPYRPLKVSMAEIRAEFPDLQEAATQYLFHQHMVAEQAEQVASETLQLIEEYCAFYQDSPNTHVATLQALLAVAKMHYYKDTKDTNSQAGYADVPVICRLRQKLNAVKKQLKEKPRTIPYPKRSVPWETALDVIRLQQEKVDTIHYFQLTKDKKGNSTVARSLRQPTAIACDLQKLLAVCFFCLTPPERNRTVAELELGRTLVRGILENGTFVPMEHMTHPERALWHFNLGPSDYKTGKAYGEYCAPIYDIDLPHGGTFYGYLQSWIDDYRPLFKPNHNQLFVKVKTTMGATPGEPITYRNMTSWIKYLFHKFTDVPVVPQSLRKMYVTYLKDSGRPEAELEAAARQMHHSRAMQSEVYDQQDLQDKLAPLQTFHQQSIRRKFQRQDKETLPLTADGQLNIRGLSNDQLKDLRQALQQEQKQRQQGKVS